MKNESGNIFLLIRESWERIFFSICGIILIFKSVHFIFIGNLTDGGVVFGLGFLSFVYANVSKFKKFKGFGFEAELWEDKKKEAESLIERLKNVVSIYTKEILISKITAGRWNTNSGWDSHWKLYDDLIKQHSDLGQHIDFSETKKLMDDYFLFDITYPLIIELFKSIKDTKKIANVAIRAKFGTTISDIAGFTDMNSKLDGIQDFIENPFVISTQGDLAGQAIIIWEDSAEKLKEYFNIEVNRNQETLNKLEIISDAYKNRPVNITPTMLEMSKDKAE